jgi:hypothetical protein
MLKYIFSTLFLLLLSVPFYGQEEPKKERVKKPGYFNGIRISYDVSNYLENYMSPFKKEEEIQVDAYFNKKYLLAGGFGITNIDREENKFKYDESGVFFKAGLDYNTLNDRRNILSVGGRLGTSFYEHEASAIEIVAYDSVWNNFTGGSVQSENFFATWLEVAFNMKVEVIKQVYLGWSVQGKLLLFNTHGNEIEPYEIPGFGRADKNAVFGFNYFVSLHIPLTSIKRSKQ